MTSPTVSEAAPVAPAAVGRQRAAWTATAATGLALLGFGPLALVIVALVTGVSFPPFFLIGVVLPLIAAVLVWRFGRWAAVVAIVVSLLAAGGLFFLAFGLAYPQAIGDFVPGLLFVAGFVMALSGAIAALVQRRRGNMTAGVTAAERRIIRGATGLVALAVVVSGILTVVSARASQDTAGAAGDAAVTMSDFAFAEAEYVVPAGQPATLTVHNSDGFVHDITIPGLDVAAQTVLPGGDAVVEIAQAQPGSYTIYCSLHSNVDETDPTAAGMAAILIVR